MCAHDVMTHDTYQEPWSTSTGGVGPIGMYRNDINHDVTVLMSSRSTYGDTLLQ